MPVGMWMSRAEGGVAAARGVKGGHAHQPVDARLAFQVAIGVLALHHDGGAFQAGLVAVQVVQGGDFKAVALGPAVVHAEQHLGPVLGLSAAGTGVEGEDSVVLIVLAGKQGGQLHGGNLVFNGFNLLFGLVHQREVLGLVAHLDEGHAVPGAALELLIGLVLPLEGGHALGDFLGLLHIVPEAGLGGLVLQHLHLFPQLFQAQGLA